MTYIFIFVAVIVGIILLLAASVLVFKLLGFLRTGSKDAIEENHPCGACVRWSECNGVDDECPRRKDHG